MDLLSATHQTGTIVVAAKAVVVAAIIEIDNPRIAAITSTGRGRPINITFRIGKKGSVYRRLVGIVINNTVQFATRGHTPIAKAT